MGELDPEKPAQEATGREGADVRIGSVVDKYTIVGMLGRGGMGAVYEARHATLARRFAIKFLLPEFAANREVLRRFENEAKAAGGLEHPNLAAVTDFGRATDGSPYLVMEFLEGEDCAKLLRRQGPLPVVRAAHIVLQACRGLAIAHRAAIVHRDLKPENLFVTDAGDGSDLVKVLDFGIAKLRITDASVITGTGATFGTAYYMSPEQARGAGDVGPSADVWSLGVVLYELLSGRKPFEGEQFLHVIHQILSAEPPPLGSLRADLPASLIEIVERAMTKDVASRVPSVVALAEALAPLAPGGSGVSYRAPVQTLAATMASPATEMDKSALGPVVRVTPGGTGGPAPSRELPGKKWAVGTGIVLLLLAAYAFVLRRRPERRVDAAVTTAQVSSSPRPAPPSTPSSGASPPSRVPDRTPVTPSPSVAPPRAAPRVQTQFGQSEVRSNKRSGHVAARRTTPTAPAPAVPNAAPAVEKPAPSHRIEIDKEDPFGP